MPEGECDVWRASFKAESVIGACYSHPRESELLLIGAGVVVTLYTFLFFVFAVKSVCEWWAGYVTRRDQAFEARIIAGHLARQSPPAPIVEAAAPIAAHGRGLNPFDREYPRQDYGCVYQALPMPQVRSVKIMAKLAERLAFWQEYEKRQRLKKGF